MRSLLLTAALAAASFPLAAQPNPFKPQHGGIKSISVGYTMTGDMTGTAALALDGQRMMRRQTSSMKMMGKTTATDSWTLMTPDSTYRADLTKKTGTSAPNLLPYMAKAYDDLDGDGKKRFHQNMEDMASMLQQGFGLANINAGEKLGKKSYAGQECEERKVGTFTVCTMTSAPIALHTQASLMCLNYEETATEVHLSAPPQEVFAPPAGIVFTPDPHLQHPDSVANGLVGYLASQQLADSIAKGKEQLEAAKAKQAQAGAQPKLTPEQEAQMQKACDMMKGLDINKMMADAGNQALKGIAEAAKKAAIDAAKNAAANKVKGMFKPKIP